MEKVSKAIAGGIAAAATTGGAAYFTLPADLGLPTAAYVAVPIINFVIGFAVVYFAPANKSA